MFFKNVFSVVAGSTLAQIIPILGSLIIARLFLPNDFGVYMSWLALVTINTVLLTARLETSISTEKRGNRRYLAVISTVVVVLVFSIISTLLLLTFFYHDAWLIADYSVFIIFTIVPAAVLTALQIIWQAWAASEGLYRILTIMRIVQSVCVTGLQIIFGLISSNEESLVFAHCMGLLISFLVLLFLLPLPIEKILSLFKKTPYFLIRHKKYAIYSLPASVMNSFSSQLPVLIFAYRFSPELAGFYALTTRVLGAPLALIGRSVLDVFKKEASDEYRIKGECSNSFNKTMLLLIISSSIFSFVSYFFVIDIFSFAFGDNWKEYHFMRLGLFQVL
jgi:O-antigen/teichoic acid export membrane protein